jgi:hypothetical protein
LLGSTRHDVENNSAVFVRRSDVEKTELIGAFMVVDARDLNRVSGIAQIDKINPFDHAAGLNIEAWNDSLG